MKSPKPSYHLLPFVSLVPVFHFTLQKVLTLSAIQLSFHSDIICYCHQKTFKYKKHFLIAIINKWYIYTLR